METVETFSKELRSLCPRVCTNCDYALEGLPEPATCPECGTREDPSVLSLTGWSQPPADLMTAWSKWWVWLSYIGLSLYLLSVLARGLSGRLMAMSMVCFILGPVFYTRIRAYFRGVEGAPLRLRISPVGFERRIGPGPLKLHPWHAQLRTSVRSRGHVLWALQTIWDGGHFVFVSPSNFFLFYFKASTNEAYALKDLVQQYISAQRPRHDAVLSETIKELTSFAADP